MKVLKMIEIYHDYMDIHLEVHALKKRVVFVQGKWYTILPALTLEGFVAVDIFEGLCDRKRFADFVLSQVVNNIYKFYLFIFIL